MDDYCLSGKYLFFFTAISHPIKLGSFNWYLARYGNYLDTITMILDKFEKILDIRSKKVILLMLFR